MIAHFYGEDAEIRLHVSLTGNVETGDGSDFEEWAIVLERITEKTTIENNTVASCSLFVYFNVRDSVSDTVIRNNVCTDSAPIRARSFAWTGENITISGNVFADTRFGSAVDIGNNGSCKGINGLKISDNLLHGIYTAANPNFDGCENAIVENNRKTMYASKTEPRIELKTVYNWERDVY